MAMVTREQLHEMLDLILDINGMEKRQQSITGDKPTAFMRFNGHTYDVEFAIHKSGWVPYNHPDVMRCVNLINGKTKEFPSVTWDDVMEELKSIKNDR